MWAQAGDKSFKSGIRDLGVDYHTKISLRDKKD